MAPAGLEGDGHKQEYPLCLEEIRSVAARSINCGRRSDEPSEDNGEGRTMDEDDEPEAVEAEPPSAACASTVAFFTILPSTGLPGARLTAQPLSRCRSFVSPSGLVVYFPFCRPSSHSNLVMTCIVGNSMNAVPLRTASTDLSRDRGEGRRALQ